MFERFTNRAQEVIGEAKKAAAQLEQNYIGTEHLLLGLVPVHDGHRADDHGYACHRLHDIRRCGGVKIRLRVRREQEQETAGEVEHSGQPRQQFLHGKFFLSLPDVQGRKRTQKQRALRPLFCMYTITYFEVFVKYCFLPSKVKAIPHQLICAVLP